MSEGRTPTSDTLAASFGIVPSVAGLVEGSGPGGAAESGPASLVGPSSPWKDTVRARLRSSLLLEAVPLGLASMDDMAATGHHTASAPTRITK